MQWAANLRDRATVSRDREAVLQDPAAVPLDRGQLFPETGQLFLGTLAAVHDRKDIPRDRRVLNIFQLRSVRGQGHN